MTKAACNKSTNRAFIAPFTSTPEDKRQAIALCESCPMRKACAKDALTAGTALSQGGPTPANDVIQAGVVCCGDDDTAWKLSRIAGVPPTVPEPTKAHRPDRCRHCHREMVKWNRYTTQPAGTVKHYARGFCEHCRKPYAEWKKSAGVSSAHRGLRKPVDRKRHSAPPKKSGVLTVQPTLFEIG